MPSDAPSPCSSTLSGRAPRRRGRGVITALAVLAGMGTAAPALAGAVFKVDTAAWSDTADNSLSLLEALEIAGYGTPSNTGLAGNRCLTTHETQQIATGGALWVPSGLNC